MEGERDKAEEMVRRALQEIANTRTEEMDKLRLHLKGYLGRLLHKPDDDHGGSCYSPLGF